MTPEDREARVYFAPKRPNHNRQPDKNSVSRNAHSPQQKPRWIRRNAHSLGHAHRQQGLPTRSPSGSRSVRQCGTGRIPHAVGRATPWRATIDMWALLDHASQSIAPGAIRRIRYPTHSICQSIALGHRIPLNLPFRYTIPF